MKLFVFFVVDFQFRCSLYILNMSPLSDILFFFQFFQNIFTYSADRFFILVLMSFDAQKVLGLMKLQFICFFFFAREVIIKEELRGDQGHEGGRGF